MTAGHCLCPSVHSPPGFSARYCLETKGDDKKPANQHVPYPTAGAGKPIEEMWKADEEVTTKNFNELIIKIGSRDYTTAINIEIEEAFMYTSRLGETKQSYDVGIIVTANDINMNAGNYPDQYVNPLCLPKR